MSKILSKSFAKQLLIFYYKNEVKASHFKNKKILKTFLENGVLQQRKIAKRQFNILCHDIKALEQFLSNQYGIKDLKAYAQIDADTTRAQAVRIASNSKINKKRVFTGIWLNTYQDIQAEYKGQTISLRPTSGGVIFFTDIENLKIPAHVTIVGMENASNFKDVHLQRELFPPNQKYLFTYRDTTKWNSLKSWLTSIPNSYLHFGDFDLAGMAIYQDEFRALLKDRAQLFIPVNLKQDLIQKGGRDLYDKQFHKYRNLIGTTPEAQFVIDLVHENQKCLEQEFYIND